VETVLITD